MCKASDSRAAYLLGLELGERKQLLEGMSARQLRLLRHHWQLWAHPGQLPPLGDWQCWLIMAGRGFGKTRAGAEWVRAVAQVDPDARIALVGATLGEARSVMVEGESGLLAIAPRGMRPKFEPSRRLLTWPNGAQAMLYSAGEPESLRGPQQSHACRTGAEGAAFERKSRADRRAAARRHRIPDGDPADQPARGAGLAGGRRSNRSLERPGRDDRQLPAGPVAVSSAARRPAGLQSGNGAGAALFRIVAKPPQAGGAERRYGG